MLNETRPSKKNSVEMFLLSATPTVFSAFLALSIKGLFVTGSTTLLCCYAECPILFFVMLSLVAPFKQVGEMFF